MVDMKVTLLCFSFLAVFTVCLSIPSVGLGDVWFPVFNPFLAATVSNAAASAQLGGSGWRGPIISIRGKNWGITPLGIFGYRQYRILYIAMPWFRLCRAFVSWFAGPPSLQKFIGFDHHGRSQCFW